MREAESEGELKPLQFDDLIAKTGVPAKYASELRLLAERVKQRVLHSAPESVPTEEATELPDIEIVSAAVHDAWMDEKRKNGVLSRHILSGGQVPEAGGMNANTTTGPEEEA